MGSLSTTTTPANSTSVEAIVHAPLSSLESTLKSLLSSLTTTVTYSNAPSITNALLSADDDLNSALQTLYQHQKNYARILQLRAEAESLEEQVKGTLRTCVDLRGQIGAVHPAILGSDSESDSDSADDDDDDGGGGGGGDDGNGDHAIKAGENQDTQAKERKGRGKEDAKRKKDVNYSTLLSLAAKIGRHNSAAAKEAEEEAVRRVIAARQEQEQQQQQPKPPTTTSQPSQYQSLIPQPELDWLDSEAVMSRARASVFPAADSLRRGLLGRLQWTWEQGGGGSGGGEVAVEKMMAELEGRGPQSTAGIDQEERKNAESVREGGGAGKTSQARTIDHHHQQQQQQQQHKQSQSQSRPHQEERKKSTVALDLDMWNEDDDDDDDDD